MATAPPRGSRARPGGLLTASHVFLSELYASFEAFYELSDPFVLALLEDCTRHVQGKATDS